VELVVGAVAGIAGVLLVVFGRRGVGTSNRKKMQVLSGLDKQEVILGAIGRSGRSELIVPRRGQLQVDDTTGRTVVLTGERKDRLIFLEQIRWIEDPLTGMRHGGRW
jgi:hypothetical protein